MVQFECQRHSNPWVSLGLGEFHFLIFLGNKGKGLWGIKVKSWKNFRKNWLKGLQMVQFESPRCWNPCVWFSIQLYNTQLLNFHHRQFAPLFTVRVQYPAAILARSFIRNVTFDFTKPVISKPNFSHTEKYSRSACNGACTQRKSHQMIQRFRAEIKLANWLCQVTLHDIYKNRRDVRMRPCRVCHFQNVPRSVSVPFLYICLNPELISSSFIIQWF